MNIKPNKLFLATIKAGAIGVALNLILLYIGKALSHPPATFGPYMLSSVAGLSAMGAVAAAAGYVIARWVIKDAHKADRWYTIVAIILLVLSFYPDVAMPWSTDSDQVGWTYGIIGNLMLMHVFALIPILYYFNSKRLS